MITQEYINVLTKSMSESILTLNITNTSQEVLFKLQRILERERGFEFQPCKLAYVDKKKDYMWINFPACSYCFADHKELNTNFFELNNASINIILFILDTLSPIK